MKIPLIEYQKSVGVVNDADVTEDDVDYSIENEKIL